MFKNRLWPLMAADGAESGGGADPAGTNPEGTNPAGTGTDPAADPKKGEKPKTYTEDDISKMKAEWEESKKKDLEEAKKSGMTEAERLAKLSESERQQEQIKKLEDENKALAEKEKARGLRDAAEKLLRENNLPTGFAELITGKDAESTNENIKLLKATFDEKVQAAVEERLKGKTPGGGNPGAAGQDIASKIGARIRGGLI